MPQMKIDDSTPETRIVSEKRRGIWRVPMSREFYEKTEIKTLILEIRDTSPAGDVNLRDAYCYTVNLINLGKYPPKNKMQEVKKDVWKAKLDFSEPVLWKRLKDGLWAKDMEQFREIQRAIASAQKHYKIDELDYRKE